MTTILANVKMGAGDEVAALIDSAALNCPADEMIVSLFSKLGMLGDSLYNSMRVLI
jgi:hypothetical protein